MAQTSKRCVRRLGTLTISAAVAATLSGVSACESAPQSELSVVLREYHETLAQHYRTGEAMRVVEFLTERWRLRGGGNTGYNEALDMVADYLRDAGLEGVGRMEVLEGPLTLCPIAWDPISASVSLVEPRNEQLHTYDELPTLLGKYSGSTPSGGVTVSLVDVGAGVNASDYADVDVRGKIVLGSGRLGAIYEQAVDSRGASGVISDFLSNERHHSTYPGIVRSGSLPCVEPESMRRRSGWGLKVTRRTADLLRDLANAGPVTLNVTVETRFFDSPLRELVVEIPGTGADEERVILVSHIDNAKPGANNNATGVATHAELAAAIAAGIESGTLEPPNRTLTFLFGPEREGTRLWLQTVGETHGALAALNADMTGADVAVTGGIYRLERSPDPSVITPRPEVYTAPDDVHDSGYPIRDFGIAGYPGHYLNQLLWSAVSERAVHVEWPAKFEPFEGGSDHDVLLPAGITTAVSWHWDDPFAGSNLDTPDKVSAEEMQNVAMSHGMTALLMASATVEQARALLTELEHAALSRLMKEAELSERLLADLERGPVDGVDEATVAERRPIEETVQSDWARWHDEAMTSLKNLPVGDDVASLEAAIDSARERVRALNQPR